MKILVCCGNGIGSSFMIEMNVKKVLKDLDVTAEVGHSDLASAKGTPADIYVATRDIAVQLEGVEGKVVALNNMIDINELKTKISEAIQSL